MARKVIIIASPGIDTAFAIAVALNDPRLEVIGLIPCPGKVESEQATANINILIGQFDPSKWPKTANAIELHYDFDGSPLHGYDGLGGLELSAPSKHQNHPAEKALLELVHQHPGEVSILCLGPVTTLIRAIQLDGELIHLLQKIIVVGGTWRVPGDTGPVSEFNFSLDPTATQKLFKLPLQPLVLPLDVTSQLILSPTELDQLTVPSSRTSQFLRRMLPHAIRATTNLFGIEGVRLQDVVGVASLTIPDVVTTQFGQIDIETEGLLTRGMMVVDARSRMSAPPNAEIGVSVAADEIKQYLHATLMYAP